MYKKLPIAVFILWVAQSVFAQTPSPTPEIVGPILTEEIVVNVSAYNRDGSAAKNLGISDLVIVEGDRLRQAVTVTRKVPSVLIAMDTGGEIRQKKNINTTRQVAEALVTGLRDDASIALMHFYDRPEMITDEWSNDKDHLTRLIRSRTKFGRRATFTSGVEMAIKALSTAPTEDRHLIFITDGLDSVADREANAEMLERLWRAKFTVHVISYTQIEFETLKPQARIWREGENDPKRMPEEVRQMMIHSLPIKRLDAQAYMEQIYPRRLLSLVTDTPMIGSRRSQLRDLTSAHLQLSSMVLFTGGTIVLPDKLDEMTSQAAQIISAINAQFVVSFEPASPLAGVKEDEIRQIKITSRNSNITVDGRRHLIVFADIKKDHK